MAGNRPRSREKNVTGGSKGVKRRGTGLGTGPVGGSSSSGGSTVSGGSFESSSSGGSGRKVTRAGGGKSPLLIIILAVVLLGGGGGLSSLLPSHDGLFTAGTAQKNLNPKPQLENM